MPEATPEPAATTDTTNPATPAPAVAAPAPPKIDSEPAKSDPWDDPAAARLEIERLRKENGAARTNAKAQAADEARKELAQTIGKAIGLVEDEPVDPAKLTEQLTQAQSQARQTALELAIFKATPDASVASVLLDSRAFLAKVQNLDPSDSAAITAAIVEAVESIPALGKRAPAPNPAQGSSASGPTSAAQLTEADVKRLSKEGNYEAIVQAQAEGRLKNLFGAK